VHSPWHNSHTVQSHSQPATQSPTQHKAPRERRLLHAHMLQLERKAFEEPYEEGLLTLYDSNARGGGDTHQGVPSGDDSERVRVRVTCVHGTVPARAGLGKATPPRPPPAPPRPPPGHSSIHPESRARGVHARRGDEAPYEGDDALELAAERVAIEELHEALQEGQCDVGERVPDGWRQLCAHKW
jgi:hypothetical protein